MLRPISGVITLFVSAAVVVFLLSDVVIRGGWVQLVLIAPWMLLMLWAVYVAVFASHVAVTPDALTVQNLLRRTRAPWARVTNMRQGLQLEVDLDDGRSLSALGGALLRAQRPGRRGIAESEQIPRGIQEFGRITVAWQDGRSGQGADAAIVRSWDAPALFVLVALLVWAAISLAVASIG